MLILEYFCVFLVLNFQIINFNVIALSQEFNNINYTVETRILRFLAYTQDRSTDISKKDSVIDMAHNTMPIIILPSDLPSTVPTLKIYCLVNKLFSNAAIKRQEFCFQSSIKESPKCQSITTNPNNIYFNFKAEINDLFGAIFTSVWKDIHKAATINRLDLSGYYSCRLTNDFGTLTSTPVYVKDTNKERTDLLFSLYKMENAKIKNISSLSRSDLPRLFECNDKLGTGMQHFRPQSLSPVTWSLCKIVSRPTEQCKSSNLIGIDILLETRTFSDGSLMVLDLKNKYIEEYTFVCKPSLKDSPFAYYHYANSFNGIEPTKGILLNVEGNFSNDGFVEITKLSDQPLKVELIAGNFPGHSIAAFYRGALNRFHWTKDGSPIDSSSEFKMSSFELIFPDQIKKEHAGQYALIIDNRSDQKYMFDVQVLHSPIINNADSIPPEIFRIHGQSVNVTFEYSYFTDLDLTVNGIKMPTRHQTEFHKAVAQLPYGLESLRPVLSSYDLASSRKVTYSADNLQHFHFNPTGQSHSVGIVLTNDFGQVQGHSVIKVIAQPQPSDYPSKTSCGGYDCQPDAVHEFQCVFDLNQYQQEGVLFRRLWFFQNTTLIDPPTGSGSNGVAGGLGESPEMQALSAFSLTHANQSLQLNPVGHNTSALNVLHGSRVTCRLLLLKPAASAMLGESVAAWYNRDLVIFDSSSPLYPNHLRMVAKIEFYADQIAKANYLWIIAVVLALILLTVLVIIAVYLKMRNPKTTYNVDNAERQLGKDPQREILEKDSYKPYNPDDERLFEETPLKSDMDSSPMPKFDGVHPAPKLTFHQGRNNDVSV